MTKLLVYFTILQTGMPSSALHVIAYLRNITQQFSNMGDKKKEKKIEKKDEFGDTTEKIEVEEKEEDQLVH